MEKTVFEQKLFPEIESLKNLKVTLNMLVKRDFNWAPKCQTSEIVHKFHDSACENAKLDKRQTLHL